MDKRLEAVNDFLLFSVMGITVSDTNNLELLKFSAIRRAYRDAAAHVLVTSDNKNLVRRPGIDCLMDCIDIDNPQSVENIIHKLMQCINDNGERELIGIGIAQKWVAMSFKYIIIAETLAGKGDLADKIIKEYAIPIDRFILKEINCSEAWSGLTKEQYEAVQNSIVEKKRECEDLFIAENRIWIKHVQNDSESVIKEFMKRKRSGD